MKKKLFRVIALVLACNLLSGGVTLYAEEPAENQNVQMPEDVRDSENNDEPNDEIQAGENQESIETTEPAVDDVEEQNNEETNLKIPEVEEQGNSIEDQIVDEKQDATILGSVEVVAEDPEKGVFTVRAYDISDSAILHDVRFAVWSEGDGQDDLTWTVVDNSREDGSYYIDVKLSDHKYALGKYIVHVYAVLDSGEQIGLGSTEHEMNIKNSELKIIEGKNSGEYTFGLEELMVPGGEGAVLFAVWSENSGQDDLLWYNAERKVDGSYEYAWSVRNHKGLGKYNVHVYVRTKGNVMKGIGAYEFNIDAPKIGSILIDECDVEKGTFTVKVEEVTNPELIGGILIPVWSSAKGQDDLVWYGTQKNEDGIYELQVNVKDHKYSDGNYNIHAYITDITGTQYFAGSTSCNMALEKGSLQVNKISDTQYSIVLSGLVIPGGTSEVLFPVWSENGGQDDLIWYSAKTDREGNYTYTLNLRDHKGLGKYNVHAYAKKRNGEQIPLLSTDFSTETPAINKFEVESIDKTAGRFTVRVSGIENSDLIKNVKIPVWSKKDQSDIVWYNARRDFAGDYIVNVNIKDHQYNIGKYNVHCYVEDITGSLNGIGITACDMSAEVEAINAEDIDGNEETFRVSVSGVRVPAGEQELRIAVWGDRGGQNDLAWHYLSRQSDGNYTLDVKIRDHCEMGLYNVHVYCLTKSGGMTGLGSTTFEVTSAPVYANVVTSEIDGNKGAFRVTISGLIAPSGIQKVEMPMWCSADQSDIAWYTASKIGEGVYTTTMSVKNHRHHFGDYKIHVYVTMGNGIRVGVSSSTIQNISPSNYLYNEYVSDTQRRIWLLGVDGELAQFPTWSDANGQDDIVWYGGTNHGNGTWSTVVDSANHSSGGNYTTHAYVTKNGVRQSVGATAYSLVKIPTDQEMMRLKANSYSSTTGYIALVNRTTHKVGIFQGWQGNWNCIQYWDCSDGKTSTPTVEGVFRVGSRGHHFYSGDAICYWWTQFYGDYLFHSVLYNRYNGSLMDGRLGMGLSHGCVRLDINNAKWIYDTIPSGTTVVVYH